MYLIPEISPEFNGTSRKIHGGVRAWTHWRKAQEFNSDVAPPGDWRPVTRYDVAQRFFATFYVRERILLYLWNTDCKTFPRTFVTVYIHMKECDFYNMNLPWCWHYHILRNFGHTSAQYNFKLFRLVFLILQGQARTKQ
jgi:hypothetical protein